VLEVPEGLDGGQFVAAVQSAGEVEVIYPDRVISITQGVYAAVTLLFVGGGGRKLMQERL
jgi:hypothetical protein